VIRSPFALKETNENTQLFMFHLCFSGFISKIMCTKSQLTGMTLSYQKSNASICIMW